MTRRTDTHAGGSRRTSHALAAVFSVVLLVLSAGLASAQAPPQPPAPDATHGVASWYGEEFAGRTTANGEIFEPLLLTAAHRTLPFGTVIEVKNSKTGQTVRARVNDRGPLVADRLIDLSYAAAREIGLVDVGSGEVDVTVVSLGRGEHEPPLPYTVTLAQNKSAPAAQQPAPQPVDAQPAVAAAPAAQPETPAAAPVAADVQSRPAPAVASSEPPAVDFPLPADVARASSGTTRPPAAAAPAEVSSVQVTEEPRGVDTRRQVSSDGRAVQTVVAETGAPVAASPDHGTAEELDRAGSAQQQIARPRGRHFVVQVGAFSVEANARALVELMTGFGMKCHIDHDTTLYKVKIGPFDTREEAIRTRNELEAKGVSAIVIGE